jgi:magnesium chelatase accessory protein
MGTEMAWRLDWNRDGQDWPNRSSSRFVTAAGVDWHVQVMGEGPVILLAHGTGASTHSWRDFAPLLAQHFTVVAPDLPGHGFSRVHDKSTLSLPGMARALRGLVEALGVSPEIVAGHSAGAAILIEMSLDHLITPKAIVSLNGAIMPYYGAIGQIFSPLAKVLTLTPLVPQFFAWRAEERRVVEQLLKGTGSAIEPEGVDFYARLARNPGHVSAALSMMANWDLNELKRRLPELDVPLILIVGGDDEMISPQSAFQVKALVRTATVVYLRRLGHLAHEEQPDMIADRIVSAAYDAGVLTGDREADDERKAAHQ